MSEPSHRLVEIPGLFHSVETGREFQTCSDCGDALAACEDGFFVQKAFCGSEPVLELAICVPCQERLMTSYSSESRERIWNFYLDHADLPGRLKRFHGLPPAAALWLGNCATCRKPAAQTTERVIAGQCFEDALVLGETPLMICGECMERIVGLLSAASLDVYDRWMDRVAPPPPGLAAPRPRQRIFI